MPIKENRNYPYEGYFWIINDEIVGISSEVPIHSYNYNLDGKTHQNTWYLFKSDYLVNGKEVDFDYFPRGRIMIDPNFDLEGQFSHYDCVVFLDRCIYNDYCKELVKDYYNLNLKSIPSIQWINLFKRSGIDHYRCHNCKNQ